MTPEKKFRKVGVSCDHVIFWGVKCNANSYKIAKGTKFKFGTYARQDSPGMPEKLFSKGGVAIVT